MMKKILVLCVILSVFAGPAMGADRWQDILKQKGICRNCEKKALVIGVGDYLNNDSNIKDLRGPKNDIVLIREELLKPVLGYTSAEILVLSDGEATRSNVSGIMENWFLKGETVKDRFFYFSGHGSRTPDRNGDEQDDGMDEVLLTHDAKFNPNRSFKPETVIIDDDLRLWFEKLKGKRLLAMLDTCHSGSGFRSMGRFSDFSVSVPRYVRSRGRFGRQNQQPGTVKTGLSEDTIPENHVYLYAAHSSQVALERQFGTGKYHGCFTRAVIQAVREVCSQKTHQGKEVSYLRLYTTLNNIIKDKMDLEQTPDIQPAFRGTAPEKYRGTNSERLLEPFVTASEQIKDSARLTTRLPNADRHRIRVLITDESIKKLLTPSDLDHIKKYAETDFSKKDKSYHLYIKILGNSVELTNANGFFLNSFSYYDKSELIEGIEKRIQHAFLKDLLEQIESEHGFPMSVTVESQGKVYDKNDFYGGQEVTYIIKSKVNAYVYVFAVDAGGELNLYLPFEHQKNNKVVKGGSIRILDPKQCGDGFVLVISEEPGEEILKIVASPTPLNIRMAEEREDYVSKLTFDEALKNIKDMIAQLKKRDVWYEGTRKYMNHRKSSYEEKFER